MTDTGYDFDKAAATWDDKARRKELVENVFAAISTSVPITPRLRVLDFGCGTGLLALRLAPLVASVVCADTSRGMLDVLEEKIRAQQLNNVQALFLNPDSGNAFTHNSYDLIVTCMTLHHIKHITPLLERFKTCLTPGGHLCIADLDLDNGLFHEPRADVFHHGFDRRTLEGVLLQAGFKEVRHDTAATIEKTASDGNTRRFTVFVITGRMAV